ncbi:MAG: molybdopterin-dependent oxidoreductase [Myxococcales bacterium]|nr:molybdopterin-dependent oxidoreductase [Myxococcales bacterium]
MSARWFHRSCPICEASCGLRVLADRERREVLRIEGNTEDPISRGHLCPKATALAGVFEDPDRIRRPIRRMPDGDWAELDWDEALDFAAEGLRRIQTEHGPEALGLYIGNPSGFDVGSLLYNRYLFEALRTPRMFSAATMDHFPKLYTSRVLFGKGSILPIPDIDRCDYFLCLGGNPIVSQGSLMGAPDVRKRLRAVQERGGRIVVVDPRRTETARVADEHLFIRPGADAYLLFSLVHVIFEEGLLRPGRLGEHVDGLDEIRALARDFSPESTARATGIPAETARRIARELSTHPRACVYGRIGTCTVEFGTLASWLVDVVNILLGRYDEPGGMMFPRPATGQHEPGGPLPPIPIGPYRTAVRGLPTIDGHLPASSFAEELDPERAGEKRVRGLFVVAGNPVLSMPAGDRIARGLASLDFMVAVDIYLNETTRHADLILPTAPQLTHDNYDFLCQSTSIHNFARYGEAVFEAEPGEKRSWEIYLELAARMLGTDAATLDQMGLVQNVTRFAGKLGLDTQAVLDALGPERGPMRLVDLQLRCGPYGDHFGRRPDGLTLEKLKAARRAIDLGPLEPRLLDILRTEGRRIRLADPLITDDVARLRERRAAYETAEGLRLVGRRQPRGMNSWLHNLPALAKGRPRCTLIVHPDDAARRGLHEGCRARVRSRAGVLEVDVALSDEVMPGVVSLPHGFGHGEPGVRLDVARERQPGANANVLTDDGPLDVPSGTSVANGIPVEIEAC